MDVKDNSYPAMTAFGHLKQVLALSLVGNF